jgi:hypothetical protein
MTPDGIRDEDWDRVHELAVEIVNAGDAEKCDEQKAQLLECLDRLEEKYGPLPSILATRADYVKEPEESRELLERAYAPALEKHDRLNVLYVASSLARLHIERLRNVTEGVKWLAAFKEALKYAGDESDIEEYEDLAKMLRDVGGSLS